MQDIYDYLKRKLKEKRVRVDEIVSRSGLSRTTIYRMMKGLLKPTPQVYRLFVDILDLDDREERELDHYVRLIDVDESRLMARKELHKMIYKTGQGDPDTVEDLGFVVYGKEQYIKKYSDLLRPIIEASNTPGFFFDIKIFNCLEGAYLAPLAKMLDKLANADSYVISHLVAFSGVNDYKNVLALKAILQLVKFSSYSVFYTYEDIDHDNRTLFEDVILMKYGFVEQETKTEKYIILSFEDHPYSDCYITEEEALYEIFVKKFAQIKKNHDKALFEQKNFEKLSNTMLEFEAGGKHCILKPNICYHRVPRHIWAGLIQRQSESQVKEMLNYLTDGPGLGFFSESSLENILSVFSERDRLSLRYQQTDVYTKDGLEALARDRRLSDHFSFLPEFSKEEIREVLENLCRKNSDPNDKFKFYIATASMCDDGLIYGVSENNGFLLEYVEPQTSQNYTMNCFVKQDILVNMAFDFVENYVPETLAMGEAEAEQYIKYIIEKYCS